MVLVEGAALGAIITGGVVAGIAAVGWLIRKVLTLRSDVDEIQNSYFGAEADTGDSGQLGHFRDEIDELSVKMDELAENQHRIRRETRNAHRETGETLEEIVELLEEEDLNGEAVDLPDFDGG